MVIYINESRSFSTSFSTRTHPSSLCLSPSSLEAGPSSFLFLLGSGYFLKCSIAHLTSSPSTGGNMPSPVNCPSPAIRYKVPNHRRVSPFSHSISWYFFRLLFCRSSLSLSHLSCSATSGNSAASRLANSLASAMAWYSKLRNVSTRGAPTIPRVEKS